MTQLREGATKNFYSVAKGFDPTERFKAQFPAEFLNAFNHPTYRAIFLWWLGKQHRSCISCGNLGTVYGTRNDPRNILLSLRLCSNGR